MNTRAILRKVNICEHLFAIPDDNFTEEDKNLDQIIKELLQAMLEVYQVTKHVFISSISHQILGSAQRRSVFKEIC